MQAAEDASRSSTTAQVVYRWMLSHAQTLINRARDEQRDQDESEFCQHRDVNSNEVTAVFEEDSQYRLLPVLVGCIIPVSILINVPSISSSWLSLQTYNATTHEFEDPAVNVPIPRYINALVIAALVNAVVCNIFILIRFLEYQVWLATVLALITATLQDILTLAAVIPFCREYRRSAGYVYEEGFWSMIASMIFSFAATFLISFDLHLTPNFSAKGSGVTHKQRILIVEAMGFCFYLALGALCLIYIEPGWSFLESLFFVMVTITTIGFGDHAVTSLGGKLFVIAYASGGIVLFAVCINAIRYVIIEDLHQRFALRAKVRKAKREAEKKERRRQRRQQKHLKKLERLTRSVQQAGHVEPEDHPESGKTLYQHLAHWTMRHRPSSFTGSPAMAQSSINPNETETSVALATSTDDQPPLKHTHPVDVLNVCVTRNVDVTKSSSPPARYDQSIKDTTAIGSKTTTGAKGCSPSLDGIQACVSAYRGMPTTLTEEPVEVLVCNSEDTDSNRSTTGSDIVSIGDRTDDELDHDDNVDHAGQQQEGDEHDYDHDGHDADDEEDGNGKDRSILSRLNPFRRRQQRSQSTAHRNNRVGSYLSHDSMDQERLQAYRESMDEYRRRVYFWVAIFIFFWLIGATIFTLIEGWNFVTSIYFVFIAFTTIGYGDVVPRTLAGRAFFLGYCLAGVVTVTSLASVVSEALSKKLRRHVVEVQLKKHRLRAGERNLPQHLDPSSDVGGHRWLNEGTSPPHPANSGTDHPHDLELGYDHRTHGHPGRSLVEHRDDVFTPEDEEKYRADLKRMIKVSQNFHTLFNRVLASSRMESPDDSSTVAHSRSDQPPHQQKQRQPKPIHRSSLPPPALLRRSPSSSSLSDIHSSSKRSVYKYLSDPDDSPSISRDLDHAREEASSTFFNQNQAMGQRSMGRFRGLDSSVQTYHGPSPLSASPASSSDQIQIMTWPAAPSPSTSPALQGSSPLSSSVQLLLHPDSFVSNEHTLNNESCQHGNSTSANNITTVSPPSHPRVNQILQAAQRRFTRRRKNSCPEWQTEQPALTPYMSNPYLVPAMSPSRPTTPRQHSDQDPCPIPQNHHILTIDCQVFEQLRSYADDCQHMVRTCEAALDRLAAWERHERKVQRRRQHACDRIQDMLREREDRLESLRGQRGDAGDVIEDEQEIMELTRQAIRLLSENPVWRSGPGSRNSSAPNALSGAGIGSAAEECSTLS